MQIGDIFKSKATGKLYKILRFIYDGDYAIVEQEMSRVELQAAIWGGMDTNFDFIGHRSPSSDPNEPWWALPLEQPVTPAPTPIKENDCVIVESMVGLNKFLYCRTHGEEADNEKSCRKVK